ncbi:hypothetical protein HPB48_007657 [Haemaphysalis longicornis]|uniref:Coiled-coil domain-containing protein 93 n=1 Tax=Haemaphysalis longicornis TaxID=44386 RepID=A0A9J6G2K3_HAELO|nr:hypothetical protein HPB48_007657 [Haemaphysalis longicornis]
MQEISDLLVAAGYFRARIKGISSFDKWLVKKAIETKAETEDIHREYAVYLFDKTHGPVGTTGNAQFQAAFQGAYAALQDRYRPRRRFRHHARHTLKTEAAQVQATLMEYGYGGHWARGPEGDQQAQQESEEIFSDMAPSSEGRLTAKSVGTIVQKQAAEAREIAEELERKASCVPAGGGAGGRPSGCPREWAARSPSWPSCALLLRIEAELSGQEARFRAHCRQEMQRLQAQLAALEPDQGAADDPRDSQVEAQCQQEREKLQRMRLLLAKKNREIAAIQRKIDEVPSRAELNQYQRRFVELYGQVAATHRETKQFFTLYNTLDDIRMYLDKEVDKKRQEAKMSRDRLHDHFLELVDKQRLYFRTVKEFKEVRMLLSAVTGMSKILVV